MNIKQTHRLARPSVRAIPIVVLALSLATATSCGSDDPVKNRCGMTVLAMDAVVRLMHAGEIPAGIAQGMSSACETAIKQRAATKISFPPNTLSLPFSTTP